MRINHLAFLFSYHKKNFLMIALIGLLLSACATHKNSTINYISKPINRITDEDAFDDTNRYLYEPPKIYRTWINSRATNDNQVVSAHYRYWVSSKGHWNVPLETELGQGAELLSPS